MHNIGQGRRNQERRKGSKVAGSGASRVAPMALAAIFALNPFFLHAQEDSQEVADARHESRISTTFQLNPYLRDSELTVDVNNRTAVLSGVVSEGIQRELAEEIAISAEGIDQVDNQIQVQDELSAEANSGDRRYGEIIEDAGITAAIKSKLLWSRYTEGLATTVDTRRGHVVLEGTAVSEAAKDLAGLLARNTRGVASVQNNLVVDPNAATRGDAEASSGVAADLRGATDDAGETLSNAWVTMKVKSTLLYSDNVSGSGIDVSTEDGVVTLSGVVGSESEHALAVQLASNVRGVKEVIAQDLTY